MAGQRVLSVVLVAALALACFAAAAWKWTLARRLDERGVRAEALVLECSSRHHWITYEYRVPALGNRRFTDTDSGGCALVGQRIPIRYLPESPGRSQREVPYPGLFSLIAGLIFLAGTLALLRPRWEDLFELGYWYAVSFCVAFFVVAWLYMVLRGQEAIAGRELLLVMVIALVVSPANFVLLRRLIRRLG